MKKMPIKNSGCAFLLLLLVSAMSKGQFNAAYGGSNYAGVLALQYNPSFIAASKLKLDVLAAGFGIDFGNNWAAVKREALSFPNLPPSWRNLTPNLPGNIYKNFVFAETTANRTAVLHQRLMLPSFMLRINSRSAMAFSGNIRLAGSITGLGTPFARLFENEFDLSVLQNNHVQNTDFLAIRMNWIEYGFTYARTLVARGRHSVSGGVTLKMLQGLEASYFHLRELDFLFSNKDNNSFLNADFSVAHSRRSGPALDPAGNLGARFRHAAPIRTGLDLGFCYEWKPGPRTAADTSRKKILRYKTGDSYKLRLGMAVIDIGGIFFEKEPNYYDLNFSIGQDDIIRYIASENLRMVDSLLQVDFPANRGDTRFRVALPGALNAQVDFSYNRYFFFSVGVHAGNLSKSATHRITGYTAAWFAPRFESYWFEVALPFTWNQMSAMSGQPLTTGINFRAGPFSVGSTDLSFLFRREIASINLYMMLRVMIPATEKKWAPGRIIP